jgi:integrase
MLVEYLGNVDVATIRHKEAVAFKDVLLALPPNMRKKFPGKTIRQVLATGQQERMGIKTVNEKLQRLSSLFGWAERHGYCQKNPFESLKLKDNRRADKQRDRFTREDLAKIFHPARFNLEKLTSFQYWVPLLAVYTGARVEELAQLRPKDVIEVDGIYGINITGEAGNLKTEQSARVIPLHPRLIELGFVDYVKGMRAKGHEKLFPRAWDTANGPGDKMSRWFNVTYLPKLGLVGKKSFHSFRHTVADELKQKGVEEIKIKAITGHKDNSITTGRYGKAYGINLLYEVICLLDYGM